MNDYNDFVAYKPMSWRKRLWQRIMCVWLGKHDEELYRKRQDHRVLLWVCNRCGKVTRKLKLNNDQLKLFRTVKRVH